MTPKGSGADAAASMDGVETPPITARRAMAVNLVATGPPPHLSPRMLVAARILARLFARAVLRESAAVSMAGAVRVRTIAVPGARMDRVSDFKMNVMGQ